MRTVMRVLTRPNVGGPTRQMVALWHAFAGIGWRTVLVVGQCEGEAAVDLGAAGVPALPDSEAGAGGDAGGYVVVPSLRRSLHPLRDLQARARLSRLIAAVAPDVVHTHTSKAGALARPLARRRRVPVVAHTFHGHVLQDYFGPWRTALLRRVETALASRTDLLFAVSASCADELAALGVAPRARIAVVPPAVDVRAFKDGVRAAARAELGLGDGELVLGFVGRLVPIKRPDLFAALVDAMQGTDAGAVGLVFGDGPLQARLAGRRGIRLLGATPRLPLLLPACDVLVLTSTREGCPLAAVEAFAAGVPVVGLDVPGVRDVLAGDGAGLLVPPAAGVAGLAAACRELRRDDVRTALVARARQTVARFDPALVATNLAAAYERALSSRP